MTANPSTSTLAGVAAVPGVAKPDAVLRVDGVKRIFGGLVAVNVEHLEIQREVITALIGPNGAGKTTLFNVLTGFDRPQQGTWELDGRPIARLAAHRVAHAGMVRTFQLTKSLSRLTVLENMKLAAVNQRGERFLAALLPGLWRPQDREIEARARDLLARFRLDEMRDEYAGTLSGGQRKLLEMARALMTEPKILMLDEPMAGVNPALTESLLDHLQELPSHGTTVLFIEHDMDVVMGLSDWVVCMSQGSVISEGPPAVVGHDPAVVDAYLGTRRDLATMVADGDPASEGDEG